MSKILVVEDDSANRDMIVHYLTLLGYQIVIARDGWQAVTLAQIERPDLSLMDMPLPVMDGWEATRQDQGGADDAHHSSCCPDGLCDG